MFFVFCSEFFLSVFAPVASTFTHFSHPCFLPRAAPANQILLAIVCRPLSLYFFFPAISPVGSTFGWNCRRLPCNFVRMSLPFFFCTCCLFHLFSCLGPPLFPCTTYTCSACPSSTLLRSGRTCVRTACCRRSCVHTCNQHPPRFLFFQLAEGSFFC